MIARMHANENPFEKKIDANRFNPAWLNRYPDASYGSLTKKIASYLGCPADRIILANGSDEILDVLLRSQFNRGDRIATLSPTFSEYTRLADLNNLTLISPKPDEETRHTPMESLLELISDRMPHGLVLCNPNNPTGQHFTDQDIETLVAAMPENSTIIIDEAYKEFCEDRQPKLYKGQSKNLIQVRTLSKAFGFAGLRIGYAILSERKAASISPYLPPYRIGHVNIQLAEHLFSPDQMRVEVQAIKDEKKWLIGEIQTLSGVKVIDGSGNFIWLGMKDPLRLKTLLAEQKIAIRDFPFPNESFCRISIGTHEENVRLADCFKEVLSGN